MDAELEEQCGKLETALVSRHHFMELDAEAKLVKLKSSLEQEARSYNDSVLSFTFMKQTWQVPIEASFVECEIESLAFAKKRDTFSYELGSGLSEISLPKIEQKPDCGLTFSRFTVESIQSGASADLIQNAVVLDT